MERGPGHVDADRRPARPARHDGHRRRVLLRRLRVRAHGRRQDGRRDRSEDRVELGGQGRDQRRQPRRHARHPGHARVGSKAGQVLTAPFRKAKDVFLRAKDAIRRRLIRTKPSGKPNPNAKPGGTRTKIPKKDTPDNQRNYELENESADALSQQGYNVEQNPKVPGAKNPDYAVEGNIFDNFSAKANTSVRNLWSTAKSKVEKGQTRRVTINLTDWKGDLNALKAQFREWRIPDLDEALAILPDGSIVRLL